MAKTTIAVDAMGGDYGPSVTVPASLQMLEVHPELQLILVGDEAVLGKMLAAASYDSSRLSLQHASQQVEMDEPPSQALRGKKDSSMRVAINLVKENKADACVSAGNTGALMATARFVLKTLPGIDRPSIISAFPTINPNKKLRILDLGANVDSTADVLLQFAVMGSVMSAVVDNVEKPKVYLLNIGEEEIKGNEQVKQTANLLSHLDAINYAGYIEGDALFKGEADVVVCDGFVGNVTLKTTEGAAKFIAKVLQEAFTHNIFSKLLAVLAKPVLKRVAKRIDPANYNGATLIGLQGTVIKSHGGAKVKGFARAIEEALICVEKNVPDLIKYQVELSLRNAGKNASSSL